MSKKPSNNQSRGEKLKLNQFGDFHFYWFFVLYISFCFGFFYNKITYMNKQSYFSFLINLGIQISYMYNRYTSHDHN